MLNLRALVGAPLLLAIALASGCGGGGPYGVSGSVKYKGQPVKAGLIAFIPEGAASPAGGAPITGGEYSVPAAAGLPAGKYRVSISVPDTKAAKAEEMPGMSGPPPKETLPVKYNASTELTAEVKPGKNVFDFDLK